MKKRATVVAGACRGLDRTDGAGLPPWPPAQGLEPIVYTVKVSKPDSHAAEIEAVYPTSGQPGHRADDGGLVAGLLSRRGLRRTRRGSLGQDA